MKEPCSTIGLTGDVMIGRLVNEMLRIKEPAYIWGDLLPIMQKQDTIIANLEAALTKSEKIAPKVFNFKSDPEHVASLQCANIGLVNLANNHVLDYDTEGLLETLETLQKAKIPYVGAGKNIEEAKKSHVLDVRGVTIAMLGCTDNEPGWDARMRGAGVNYLKVGDIDKIKDDIIDAKNRGDIVIVSCHLGPNMIQYPEKSFIQFTHSLIDCGADIVHGHSAHIFQGVEVYKNKLILHDTGDFVDDYYVDPYLRNDCSFLFLVQLDSSGPKKLRMLPTIITNCQVNLASGKTKQRIQEKMKLLCAECNTECTESEEGLEIRL